MEKLEIGLDVGSLSFMLAEIEKSSEAMDLAVTGAVRDLREENIESVSRSVLVFLTYTVGSLFLVTFITMLLIVLTRPLFL